MQTIKQEYRKFLYDNFKTTEIKNSLYAESNGILFNLQTGETYNSKRKIVNAEGYEIPMIGDTDTEEYFIEVFRRAIVLFEAVFDANDQIYLIYRDYKYKKRKIRFDNYVFRQIAKLNKSEIYFYKGSKFYDPEDKYNIALIKLPVNRINYKNILTAIGNSDFHHRKPRLDEGLYGTNKEVFFLNIDKKIIYNMYDDMGLYIIASDIETLRPIYKKFYDWILISDRDEIDKQFE